MMKPQVTGATQDLDDIVTACGRPSGSMSHSTLVSAPLFAALRKAGTSHVYADTADVRELRALLSVGQDAILAEIDGNTVNQPLVHKVLARYLEKDGPSQRTQKLTTLQSDLPSEELLPLLYSIVCARIGNHMSQAFASGRAWEVSLQLHMGLCGKPSLAKQLGRYLRRMVPSAFVKVPFTPQSPDCFLVARDLEREGIPVNFTSTFSARQTVAAALLADVTRTNIFMGRLNQGLRAESLGEHVVLEAQRALTRLRQKAGVKTQLIVASMREWQTFVRTAGCDAYTAPCAAIRGFLAQREVSSDMIQSQLQTSYEDRLGVASDVLNILGHDRITQLYRVDPGFVDFLREYSATDEYRDLQDGQRLFERFDEAGFGDFFYSPMEVEWKEIRRAKLPDLQAPLTKQLSLDTLYSLLADADFEKHQGEMDREIDRRASPLKAVGSE